MADLNSSADAVYDLIADTAAKLKQANMSGLARSAATANLALAVRYLAGGDQPGGSPAGPAS